MMKIFKRLTFILVAGLLLWPLYAGAVTLNEAVSQVREQHDVKKVLVAETRSVRGRQVHIIRILTNDGRVRQIRVNAGSGH